MLASIFSLNVIQTALELGCIYALVALALRTCPPTAALLWAAPWRVRWR